ncbi:N-acetyltransferase family protein [Promineifilum sp.]|uniref:GNAT family N-acetyltransferase n=1 Tax=Promineifilum sp. TaxID=2664178 RepID=UPI0035B33326
MIAIRRATTADESTLWEMLYYAIYQRPDEPPLPRHIVRRPELSRYVDGWGRPDDSGFVAAMNGQPIGAVWLRALAEPEPGYGYVNDETPELSMAVLPAYRGRGIGSQLLTRLLSEAARRYPGVSLSVAADNPARRLYERHGFVAVKQSGDSLTMLWSRG